MIVVIGTVAILLGGLLIIAFPDSRLAAILLAPTWPRSKVSGDVASSYRKVGIAVVLVSTLVLLALLL